MRHYIPCLELELTILSWCIAFKFKQSYIFMLFFLTVSVSDVIFKW